MKRCFLAIAAVFAFFRLDVAMAGDDAPVIDAQTAVRLAEQYVLANGYTAAPATKSIDDLDPTTYERLPREKWPDLRRGTLETQAYGYKRGVEVGEQGWTVLFRVVKKFVLEKDGHRYYLGVIVQMDPYGHQLIMQHGTVLSLPDSSRFDSTIWRDAHRP